MTFQLSTATIRELIMELDRIEHATQQATVAPRGTTSPGHASSRLAELASREQQIVAELAVRRSGLRPQPSPETID